MRKSKQGILTALFILMIIGSGCAELAKIGQGMQKAGDIGKKAATTVGPVTDSFFPRSSKILSGVSALLTIGGAGLYKLASKRLSVTQSIIQGVGYATDKKTDIKDAISTIATNLKVEPYLNKLVQQYDPPKLTTTT